MVRKMTAIGDRLLAALLPKAQANAYNCWYVPGGGGCAMEKCCYYPEIPRTYCWCV
jgi:hypothetical protein